MIEIPNRSLAMIMTTSFPGYDIRMSDATTRPNVRKPNTPETDDGMDGEGDGKREEGCRKIGMKM